MLRQVHFTGAAGHRLSGFHLAGNMPGMVLAGGYGQFSPVTKAFGQRVIAYCQARNLELHIIEFRGQGDSEGHRFKIAIPDMRDDLLALAEHFDLSDRIAIGSSLGAWAMLAAQQERPSFFWGKLALAPAVDWDRTYLLPRLDDGRATREADRAIVVRDDNILVFDRFLDSAEDVRVLAGQGPLFRGPVRILHGSEDMIAPLSRSLDLLTELAEGNDAALRIFPGLDHDVSLLNAASVQRGFIEECDLLLQAFRRYLADRGG